MTDTHYPRSLRQALAYLDANPLVSMVSRYAKTITRSRWWYVGFSKGTIWFEPYPVGHRLADTGLGMGGSELEIGLEFDARGITYSRGNLTIRVEYANTLEALK